MAAAREGSRVMVAVARVMRSKRGMNVDVRYDIDLLILHNLSKVILLLMITVVATVPIGLIFFLPLCNLS